MLVKQHKDSNIKFIAIDEERVFNILLDDKHWGRLSTFSILVLLFLHQGLQSVKVFEQPNALSTVGVAHFQHPHKVSVLVFMFERRVYILVRNVFCFDRVFRESGRVGVVEVVVMEEGQQGRGGGCVIYKCQGSE